MILIFNTPHYYLSFSSSSFDCRYPITTVCIVKLTQHRPVNSLRIALEQPGNLLHEIQTDHRPRIFIVAGGNCADSLRSLTDRMRSPPQPQLNQSHNQRAKQPAFDIRVKPLHAIFEPLHAVVVADWDPIRQVCALLTDNAC